MPRAKVSEITKQCRNDLRILLMWRLSDGQEVVRAILQTWLASNVDVGWRRNARPSDLGDAQQEADKALGRLLQSGNCTAVKKRGGENIRLVQSVKALDRVVGKMRDIEKATMEKTRDRVGNDWW